MPLYPPSGGGGGGAVSSVNGQTGIVVLTAASVGADASGAASAVAASLATVATSGAYADLSGKPTIYPSAVVTLTDGATVALNGALGRLFRLAAAGDRTISIPTGLVDGQPFIIAHRAVTTGRTLTLTTTGTGCFKFGSDFTSIPQTVSGTTDYIGCIYDSARQLCDVVSLNRGFV